MALRASPRLNPKGVGLDSSSPSSASFMYGDRYGGFKSYNARGRTEGYDWDEAYREKPPKTLPGVLTRFATFTSLQGVPFMNRARRWYSRLAWTCIFILGLVATSVQLYLVINKYLTRETTSMVKIGYDTLDFPSVTVCNMNPLRNSWIDRDTDLGDLLNTIKPRENYKTDFTEDDDESSQEQGSRVRRDSPDGPPPPTQPPGSVTVPQNSPPDTRSGTGPATGTPTDTGAGTGSSPTAGTGQGAGTETGTMTGSAPGTESGTVAQGPGTATGSGQQTGQASASGPSPGPGPDNDHPPGLGSSWLGDLAKTQTGYDKYRESLSPEEADKLDQEFGGGEPNAFSYVESEFKYKVANISKEERIEWGHQGELFILDCSFNSRMCSSLYAGTLAPLALHRLADEPWIDRNFTRSLNIRYGNCYTFNGADMLPKALKAARGGAPYGLNLVLYLEKHEYIPGFTSGSGARVAIHPFNTMPFLEEHGMSAAPGFETFIGMKMVNMSRLGLPYTTCGDNGVFEREHNKTYSLDGCLNTCMDRVIARTCNCTRRAHPEFYTAAELASLPLCDEEGADSTCTEPILTQITAARKQCTCNEACKEIQYDVVTSSNVYPEGNIWHTLVDTVCAIDKNACASIYGEKDKDPASVMRNNILQLRIFYRDLNFQSIEEIASYDEYQFLSDLGGSLGLWVGASALTVLEVVDLMMHLCKFFCCDRSRQISSQTTRRSDTKSNHSYVTNDTNIPNSHSDLHQYDSNGRVVLDMEDVR